MPANKLSTVNPYSAMIHAKALAEGQGLSIQFSEKAQSPSTDRRVLTLPKPDPYWSKPEWSQWWSHFYHEVGHHAPEVKDTVDYITENKVDADTPFGSILNTASDYRQEKNGFGDYIGKQKHLQEGRRLQLDNIIKENQEVWSLPEGQNKDFDIWRTMLTADSLIREDWMPVTEGSNEALLQSLPKELQDKVKKVVSKYGSAYDAMSSVEDEISVSKSILEDIFELDPEKEQQAACKAKGQSGQGEGEKSEGDEEGEGDGESSGEGEGQDGEGEGKRSDKEGHVDLNWDDIKFHKHNPQSGSSYSSQSIKYTDVKRTSDFQLYPESKIEIVDLSIPKSNKHDTCTTYSLLKGGRLNPHETYRRKLESALHGEKLSRKVERLLRIHTKDKYEYGLKKGKLHAKNLYRGGMKEARGFNERVMRNRKENETTKSVAIYLLGDGSGSMGGSKFVNMGKSMLLMNKVLTSINIPHEMAIFTEEYNLVHYTIKPFSENKPKPSDLADRIATTARNMCGNADADSLLIAAGRLQSYPAQRKIMIVLSDGEPADAYGSRTDAANLLKTVCEDIEARKDMELYAIGIEDSSVKHFYKDREVIRNSTELEGALLNLIKRKIIIK